MSAPAELLPDFYRILFEEANDAIFLADVETGRLLDANPRACELIGRTRDAIRGMHHLELHPREERERYRAIFEHRAEAAGGSIAPKSSTAMARASPLRSALPVPHWATGLC